MAPLSKQPEDFAFGAFDGGAEVSRSYRHLPHWFQPGTVTFITFRTGDSMPRAVIARWQEELNAWLARHGVPDGNCNMEATLSALPPAVQREYRHLRNRLWHRCLDDCHGTCALRDAANARIVGDALQHFDGERYHLDCYVVMPNHVHVLVQFLAPCTLASQTTSWLRYTATQINKRLSKSGPFWQPEPFNHLIRSAEQFEYVRQYIADNPKKSNLLRDEYLYWKRP